MNCKIKDIFDRQTKLMDKYHGIEVSSGTMLTAKVPVDINCGLGQQRLKDFAWRVTEELMESLEALVDNPGAHAEELIDALHFMAELCILAGITTEDLRIDINTALFALNKGPSDCVLEGYYVFHNTVYGTPKNSMSSSRTVFSLSQPEIERATLEVLKPLGKAMNELKNRPWKQTKTKTDFEKFNQYICDTLAELCLLIAGSTQFTPEQFLGAYINKNVINQNRQDSNY